jgi:zinc protease
LNPSFPEKEFTRLQKQTLARIQQEKASPFAMALRVLPKFIYGEGHAYGNPFTGSGTEAAVKKMSLNELKKFHQDWFKSNNATLVVVGDVKLNTILPKLEQLFKNWKSGNVPRKNISTVAQKSKASLYLIDKPGAQQSAILVGHVAPPKADADDIAMNMFNNVLGGTFTSRINMNIREDKHWSYGAGSIIFNARGQRPFLAYAPIQSDKTKESVQEIMREMKEIISTRPTTQEELDKVLKNEILGLPGTWETIGAVGGSINEIVTFGLADDFYQTYSGKLSNLKLKDIANAAQKLLHPEQTVWVVVGDRAKVEPTLKELGMGEVQLIDTDGNPVK